MNDTVKPAGNNGWLVYGALGLSGFLIFGGAFAGTDCNVSNVQSRADTFYNGGLDYGIVVTADVKNNGSGGQINIEASLSTSEGNFQRVRQYLLEKGQETRVEFQFLEPTINVNTNDLQAVVRCVDA